MGAPVLHPETAQAAGDARNIDAVALASQVDPITPAPPPPPPLRPIEALRAAHLVFDFRLLTGVAWATLSQDSNEVRSPLPANFLAGCAGASVGFGRFAGSHVKIGYEGSGGVQRVLGTPQQMADTFGYSPPPQKPMQGDTWYFFPVGAYLAVYPWTTNGLSLGVHLGMGVAWVPDYESLDGSGWGGTAALELGYDDAWSTSMGWSLRLRYGATEFTRGESDSEYYTYTTQQQNTTELTLVAGLSWF